MNELDAARKLTKEEVLQIEASVQQQQLLLQLEANKIIWFPWDKTNTSMWAFYRLNFFSTIVDVSKFQRM